MSDAPRDEWIISVDDHVIEPPSTWISRLPSKYQDEAPQVRHIDGIDTWCYDGKQVTISGAVTQAGRPPADRNPLGQSYSEMPLAAYDPKARLEVLDQDGILASLCFPNFPRFCGQVFYEAEDKDLALLCVKAYNDFILDEWTAGSGGRLIPCIIVPLWDPDAAADEIERCAGKGARSVALSERPSTLGLPSIHDADRYWDPVLGAASQTGMVVSMHLGSMTKLVTTSRDAPQLLPVILNRWTAASTFTDWMLSEALVRFPSLRLSLAEGGIDWFPLALNAFEHTIENYGYLDRLQLKSGFMNIQERDTEVNNWPHGDRNPLDVMQQHIRGCFVGGLASSAATTRSTIDTVGTDVFMAEADFPHCDSSFPHTVDQINQVLDGLPEEDKFRLRRGNAIDWYRLDIDEPVAVSAGAGSER